jgi:hypothetical protein
MRSFHRLGTIGVAFAVAGCGKACGEGQPSPDVCSGPRPGRVERAEVGQGTLDDFVPFVDGDAIHFVFSDEGTKTLPIVFRVTGDDVPFCVEQRTELFGCRDEACDEHGTSHARFVAPLHLYLPDGDETATTRESHELYLELEREDEPVDGARLELVSQIAGIDLAVQLRLDQAGPDAGGLDAGP